MITRVRFRAARPWQPVLGYLDLERKMAETGITAPDARQIFDWVCAIRRAKLPDPARSATPAASSRTRVVTPEQCRDIIGRDPEIVHYPLRRRQRQAGGGLDDRRLRLEGQVGRQRRRSTRSRRWCWSTAAAATGAEVVTLARAIQESVYGRFGIRLEPEPVVV